MEKENAKWYKMIKLRLKKHKYWKRGNWHKHACSTGFLHLCCPAPRLLPRALWHGKSLQSPWCPLLKKKSKTKTFCQWNLPSRCHIRYIHIVQSCPKENKEMNTFKTVITTKAVHLWLETVPLRKAFIHGRNRVLNV